MSLPAPAQAPATRVIGVHPTAERWPANLLRAYIHFSGPMSRESGVGRITLRGDDGVEVTDAFLPLDTDFWNSDHPLYGVFRSRPGEARDSAESPAGPRPGGRRRYTLEVTDQWRDAAGRPLGFIVHADVFRRSRD